MNSNYVFDWKYSPYLVLYIAWDFALPLWNTTVCEGSHAILPFGHSKDSSWCLQAGCSAIVWRASPESTGQTFTAICHLSIDKRDRIGSILLGSWSLGANLQSHTSSSLSFGKPIQVMVSMKIQGCSNRLFSKAVCTNQARLHWQSRIWSITAFSITQSFTLGLSIWTPWKDIHACLLRRIYATLLATQVKYKPKVTCPTFYPFYSQMLISFVQTSGPHLE